MDSAPGRNEFFWCASSGDSECRKLWSRTCTRPTGSCREQVSCGAKVRRSGQKISGRDRTERLCFCRGPLARACRGPPCRRRPCHKSRTCCPSTSRGRTWSDAASLKRSTFYKLKSGLERNRFNFSKYKHHFLLKLHSNPKHTSVCGKHTSICWCAKH